MLPRLLQMEVTSTLQLPSFHIIGLPSPEVAEAKDRVRSAILASGLKFPKRRVLLNLSPASIRKQGTGLDLAMALSVLSASLKTQPPKIMAWGELGLNGSVKPCGQLTRVLYACWKAQIKTLLLSSLEFEDGVKRLKLLKEGHPSLGNSIQLIPVENLAEAWEAFRQPENQVEIIRKNSSYAVNSEAKQNFTQKSHSLLLPLRPSLERILGVSAAGNHHIFLVGPRGTGKSHALDWLIELQPEMNSEQRVTQSLLQEINTPFELNEKLPVRRIGIQTRPTALTGTITNFGIKPGEFSMAHGGLLIADELPEWDRDAREALREPLERGTVTLTRSRMSVEFPAKFLLAASGNFCPCGGWPPEIQSFPSSLGNDGDNPACVCVPHRRRDYMNKISGPLLDRIDIAVQLTQSAATDKPIVSKMRFDALKTKVAQTRMILVERWGKPAGRLLPTDLEELLSTHPKWTQWLDSFPDCTLRGRHKLLRVALTFAAWDQAAEVSVQHFKEAALYRAQFKAWHVS